MRNTIIRQVYELETFLKLRNMMDDKLRKQWKEVKAKKWPKQQEDLISNCCSAPMTGMFLEIEMCPECHEHCGVVKPE